jgi:hypothetical protein
MARPGFELGVADVRAGRGFRPDYEDWPRLMDQWSYERGRQWAVLTPRNVRLKRDGEVTESALHWFISHHDDIR